MALWPRMKSMRRALRCDGVVCAVRGRGAPGLACVDARDAAVVVDNGARPDIDVIAHGETPGNDPDAAAVDRRSVGGGWCTWWLETNWEMPHHSGERMRQVGARLAGRASGAPLTSEADRPWCRGRAVSSVDGSAEDLGAEGPAGQRVRLHRREGAPAAPDQRRGARAERARAVRTRRVRGRRSTRARPQPTPQGGQAIRHRPRRVHHGADPIGARAEAGRSQGVADGHP